MANLQLLNRKIAESGMTKAAIARKSGMERPTLCNRLKGRGHFCYKSTSPYKSREGQDFFCSISPQNGNQRKKQRIRRSRNDI